MDRQVYPDGFQIELASGYHCVVINGYMAFWRAAQALEVKLPDAFLKELQNMLELLVKLMRPDACLPDINDGSLMWVPGYLQENSEFCTGNKTLRWAANGCTGKEQPDYTSVMLEYAGMAIMRDGWSEQDTWGFLDAGPFGSGHQHEDKLNFLLHANGKYILTECGNYDYDDSQMRRYALSTRSHNTVRVNGQDQNRRRNYRWHEEDICKKANLEYRLEEFYDYAAGVYDEGYGEQKKEAGSRECAEKENNPGAVHGRSVIFLKKPGPKSIPAFPKDLHSFFIVIDRMEAAEEKEYEFLWHVDAETVVMQGMHVKADFLHIFNNLDDVKKDGVSLVCCQRTPCWQGWKRGKTFVQGNDDALPTVRYTTYDASARVVTVLYPEEDCCIAAVKAGRSIDDTKITLVFKDGTCVELDENVYRP